MNRIKKLVTLFAFTVLVLGLPTLASAQWRDRDRDRDDDDYYKNDRRNRDDDYRNGNRRYNRNLQATIKNLKNRSKEFAKRVDRELDNRRNDRWGNGNNRIEDLADSFKEAADDLDDTYDNRRDYSRSEDEARRVIQLGQQLDNALYRSRLSYNLQNDWDRIRQDLNTLANAYGYNYNNRNNRNNRNNTDWRNRLPWPF